MRMFLGIFLVTLLLVLPIFGQTGSPAPRTDLTNEILSPDKADLIQAEQENLQVFKLLPRGMFDSENNDLKMRGGGAYYSFTKKSHSYNKIPQIELQQNNLSVGFYGANYGLIADLGNSPLSSVDEKTAEIILLLNYQPRQIRSEVEAEHRNLHQGLKISDTIYKKWFPASVGNTYVLRAISFDEADTLVAFKIHREDADGGLIIFWKPLEEFEVPTLLKPRPVVDAAAQQAVENALREKGFYEVTVEATTTEVTLRGTVPKGKLAQMMQTAQEVAKRKVNNQVTEHR